MWIIEVNVTLIQPVHENTATEWKRMEPLALYCRWLLKGIQGILCTGDWVIHPFRGQKLDKGLSQLLEMFKLQTHAL